MSLFGANSAQPVPGQGSPHTSRINPDRQRREKQEHKEKKHDEHQHAHREEDRAEFSTPHEADAAEPVAHVDPPPPPPDRPRIDIQG